MASSGGPERYHFSDLPDSKVCVRAASREDEAVEVFAHHAPAAHCLLLEKRAEHLRPPFLELAIVLKSEL
jgi:hypothetical protein